MIVKSCSFIVCVLSHVYPPSAPAASACACLSIFKHVSTDTTLSNQAPTCCFRRFNLPVPPHLCLFKRVSTDTSLALMASAAPADCVCCGAFTSSYVCPPTRHAPSWHQLLPQLQPACAPAPLLPQGCSRSFSLCVVPHLPLLQTRVNRHDARPPDTHPRLPQPQHRCAPLFCLFTSASACPPTPRSPSWHQLLPQLQLVRASTPLLLPARVQRQNVRLPSTSCSRSFIPCAH